MSVDKERKYSSQRNGKGSGGPKIKEQLVKTTARKGIGKKLVVCNRAVKWWDEEVKRGYYNSEEREPRKIYIK